MNLLCGRNNHMNNGCPIKKTKRTEFRKRTAQRARVNRKLRDSREKL